MNEKRRKRLQSCSGRLNDIIDEFSKFNLSSKLSQIGDEVEAVKDEEEEAFDNLPDQFQCGLKGVDMESAINELEELIENIESIIDDVSQVADDLKKLNDEMNQKILII
ncbi:hypothetical protein AALA22_13100 [Anaerovoracaceae bacterium 41-7]